MHIADDVMRHVDRGVREHAQAVRLVKTPPALQQQAAQGHCGGGRAVRVPSALQRHRVQQAGDGLRHGGLEPERQHRQRKAERGPDGGERVEVPEPAFRHLQAVDQPVTAPAGELPVPERLHHGRRQPGLDAVDQHTDNDDRERHEGENELQKAHVHDAAGADRNTRTKCYNCSSCSRC